MRLLQILVVEDDADIAARYRLEFESHGFLVRVAKTGETALTLVRQSRWDLVLLDMELTGMSWLQVLAALRSDARAAGSPVVVLSSRHDTELLDRAFALGAVDYVIKSHTTPAQLAHNVPHWVARRVLDGQTSRFAS